MIKFVQNVMDLVDSVIPTIAKEATQPDNNVGMFGMYVVALKAVTLAVNHSDENPIETVEYFKRVAGDEFAVKLAK